MDNRIHHDGHVKEQISAYLDGLLDERTHDSVQAHIEVCSDCRTEYLEVRETRQLLRLMPTVAPPRAFTLTPEMAGSKVRFWERLLVPRNVPRLATGSVLAFALVLLVMVGRSGVLSSPNSAMLTGSDRMAQSQVATGAMEPTTLPLLVPRQGVSGDQGGSDSGGGGVGGGNSELPIPAPPMESATSNAIFDGVAVLATPTAATAAAKVPFPTVSIPLSAGGGSPEETRAAELQASSPTALSVRNEAPPSREYQSSIPAQASADGGSMLLFSIEALLVTLGGLFALGAVIASRR